MPTSQCKALATALKLWVVYRDDIKLQIFIVNLIKHILLFRY